MISKSTSQNARLTFRGAGMLVERLWAEDKWYIVWLWIQIRRHQTGNYMRTSFDAFQNTAKSANFRRRVFLLITSHPWLWVAVTTNNRVEHNTQSFMWKYRAFQGLMYVVMRCCTITNKQQQQNFSWTHLPPTDRVVSTTITATQPIKAAPSLTSTLKTFSVWQFLPVKTIYHFLSALPGVAADLMNKDRNPAKVWRTDPKQSNRTIWQSGGDAGEINQGN